MSYDLTRLQTGAKDLGVELSEKQLQQYLKFYELLVETNKVMNLTAITEFDEVVEKHFLDSISIVKYVDLNTRTNVLDLGTGAGFPGIPLAIAFPELKFTLMDSLAKRVRFLDTVIAELGLVNVNAIHGRAEETGRDKAHREAYDLCVSRAVANIATLSEYCLPFVTVGGQFVSYKSAAIDEEIEKGKRAIAILGGGEPKVHKFTLPGTDMDRSFVVIDKLKPTAKKYPRKPGTPSKEPLA